MRVGLVIYDSLDTVSGGYLYDRRLVRYLREAGDSVEIISLPGQDYGRLLMHNLRPSLVQRLQRGGFDLLLQDELCHPSLYLLNRRLRRSRPLPLISIVHHLRCSERHPAWLMPRYRRIERLYLRSVDGFIFNSETTRAAVEALAGISLPCAVAHPAADHVGRLMSEEQIERRARQGERLRVLFAGNVIPRKGVHVLLRALAQLGNQSWRLAIAGDSGVDREYAANLRTQIGRASIAEQVTWYGRVSDGALWRLMAQSDVLAVPSDYEGFGIAYLEGMAFGLPALATSCGAAREIIRDGSNGFLVEPGDAASLAGRLRLLQRDRRLLARMSLAALARFQAAPTWSETMAHARRWLVQMASKGE